MAKFYLEIVKEGPEPDFVVVNGSELAEKVKYHLSRRGVSHVTISHVAEGKTSITDGLI